MDDAASRLPLLGLSAVGDMLFHHPRLIGMIGSGICLNNHQLEPTGGIRLVAKGNEPNLPRFTSPTLTHTHTAMTYTLMRA